MNIGIALIADERERQIMKEDYSYSHEDKHDSGDLAKAAACPLCRAEKNKLGGVAIVEVEAPKPPSLYCLIFHRRWILWHTFNEPICCGRCCNQWNWQWHLNNQEQSDKNWKHHLREVGKLW